MSYAMPLVGLRTRARIAPFRLHRPSTVEEAIECMRHAEEGTRYMAGGIDVTNAMKSGLSCPEVVYLGGIEALKSIRVEDGCLRIGALVTHQRLIDSPLVAEHLPDLRAAWMGIAHPRVRFKGTIGGNLMAREPAYEAAPLLMAMGATVRFQLAANEYVDRPIADLGAEQTGLLHSIAVPLNRRLYYDRSLVPMLTVALGLRMSNGRIAEALVVVGGGSAWPLHRDVFLQGALKPEEFVGRLDSGLVRLDPPQGFVSDWRASAEYRHRAAGVLLRRLAERIAP